MRLRDGGRVREKGERNPTVEGLKQLEESLGFLAQGFCVRDGVVVGARELWALALRSLVQVLGWGVLRVDEVLKKGPENTGLPSIGLGPTLGLPCFL